MVTTEGKITFEEYLKYNDGKDNSYELVNGKLVLMPPASFLHSDIIDFIADLIKGYCRKQKLNIKVKTGDVGVKTNVNSSRIPDLVVIDGQIWQSYGRGKSAVIDRGVLLVVEVVSPGLEQIERDYTQKVKEYQNIGIKEYWIVDPMEQKVTVSILEKANYNQTVFTGNKKINSMTFPLIEVTANEILEA